MLCRMTRCCSWNLLPLIILLLHVIMNAYCYSCDKGRQPFSTCNCQDKLTKCVTEVEARETAVQLSCCLNASQGISWYKDKISKHSKIGYDHITNTNNYTAEATQIDRKVIAYSEDEFKFSDGGKKFTISQARFEYNGTYICVSGEQEFDQYLDVRQDFSRRDSMLHSFGDSSKVGAHLSEETTLCCKFKINARVENISIKWFLNNATKPLKTDNNYNITSECSERTYDDEATLMSTVVETSLKLSDITRASYGNYTAEVSLITYKKHKEMTTPCVLMLYESDDHDEDKEETFGFGYLVIGSIIFTIILVIIFGWICYRYKILIALLWSNYCRTLKDDPENKHFDAFIAYSNSINDCNFVHDSLLPFLKKHNFSSCVRDIDFLPGGDIFDDSTVAVEGSLRTILILSPEFIENTQCLYELEVALRNMINLGNRHKIIPIILKDITKSEVKKFKQLERLLFIVKTLRWFEEKPEIFHKKLLELMPKTRTMNSDGHCRFFNSAFTLENSNHV